MAEQDFVYTCTGTEANGATDFFVSLPLTWTNNGYSVSFALRGVALIFAVDLPANLGAMPPDRSSTQFRIVTSAPVANGDKIEFRVYDAAQGGELGITRGEALAMSLGYDMP